MTKTTKTTTTTDAAVAVYTVTVGDRQAYVRAVNGTEAICKFVRAKHPTATVRGLESYGNEAGVVETRGQFSLGPGRSEWPIYAAPISILD